MSDKKSKEEIDFSDKVLALAEKQLLDQHARIEELERKNREFAAQHNDDISSVGSLSSENMILENNVERSVKIIEKAKKIIGMIKPDKDGWNVKLSNEWNRFLNEHSQ